MALNLPFPLPANGSPLAAQVQADFDAIVAAINGGSGIVTSVTGTANQVIVSSSTGSITLSLPQNINTGASPTFSALNLSATSNQLILGSTRTLTITAPTPATSSRTWTVPDISGNGTFAALEGTQTFTGLKTFNTVYIKGARPWIDVRGYGATGDGSTDDATAIQNALNAAHSNSGATVYFPDGTYLVGTRLVVYSNTILQGASEGKTIVKAKSTLTTKMMVNQAWGGTGTDTNIQVRNITFDENGAAHSTADDTTVTFARVNDSLFYRCGFINGTTSLFLLTGSLTTDNNHVYFVECVFDSSNLTGGGTDITDIGNGYDIQMIRCRFLGGYTASGNVQISAAAMTDFIVRDCYFDGQNNASPLGILGITGGGVYNCEIFNSTEFGLKLSRFTEGGPTEIKNFQIIGNRIHDNGTYGIWLRQESSSADFLYDIRIADNSIYNNQRNAVRCDIMKGLLISGNSIYNNSLSGVGSYYTIDLNSATTSSGQISSVLISGNRFYDNQGTATQTKLYNLNYTNSVYTFENLISQITTYSTVTNSTNTGIRDQEGLTTYLADNGTASVPTFSFLNSLAAGMYSSAANEIDFSTNSTQRVKITSTGDFVVTGGNINATALTVSTAIATDASKNLVSSTTTSTELGYVHGVTSALQTQLNTKTATTTTVSAGTGLTGGGDLSTNRTISLSTPVATTNGGTGLATYAQGDIVYGSASNTLAALAKSTTATRYLANTGTTNNPNWDQINLSNGVTSTLPIANGGTNSATSLANGKIMGSSAGTIIETALATANVMQTTDTRFFIGSLTRDTSTANGSVAYTGVGFSPKAVIFFAVIPGGTKGSWGFDNASVHKGVSCNALTALDSWSSSSIIISDGTETNYHTGSVSSLDSDGFTIAWVKTGSPTGTATVFYMALK